MKASSRPNHRKLRTHPARSANPVEDESARIDRLSQSLERVRSILRPPGSMMAYRVGYRPDPIDVAASELALAIAAAAVRIAAEPAP